MVVDCVRNGESRRFRQAGIKLLDAGVKPADNALQFRELFHQFRCKISLRQARGFVDHAWAHSHAALLQELAQPTAQPLHSLRLFVIAAKIFLEGNVPQ